MPSMNTSPFSNSNPSRLPGLAISLGSFAGIAYVLVALNVLTVGNLNMTRAPMAVVCAAALSTRDLFRAVGRNAAPCGPAREVDEGGREPAGRRSSVENQGERWAQRGLHLRAGDPVVRIGQRLGGPHAHHATHPIQG